MTPSRPLLLSLNVSQGPKINHELAVPQELVFKKVLCTVEQSVPLTRDFHSTRWCPTSVVDIIWPT